MVASLRKNIWILLVAIFNMYFFIAVPLEVLPQFVSIFLLLAAILFCVSCIPSQSLYVSKVSLVFLSIEFFILTLFGGAFYVFIVGTTPNSTMSERLVMYCMPIVYVGVFFMAARTLYRNQKNLSNQEQI